MNPYLYELNAYAKPGLGTDANFMPCHDGSTSTPNDIKVRIPYDQYGNPSGNSIFDLAGSPPSSPIRTWAFWMRFMPKDNKSAFLNDEATMLRLGMLTGGDGGLDPNYYWEIRLYYNKLQFQQKNGSTSIGTLLTVQTADIVLDMGVNLRTWHHVAMVIDRNTKAGTKIYFDGLERTVNVIDYRTTAAMPLCVWQYGLPVQTYYNPLTIGAGRSKCNELLDEIRLYNRALTPLEISILKQTDAIAKPIALIPIPGSSDVVKTTDVNWVPAAPTGGVTLTSQEFNFGTDPCALVALPAVSGSTYGKVLNSGLGLSIGINTTYYWRVDSNYSDNPGVYVAGPTWSFTTETGKARNPTPFDGQEYVSGTGNNIRLMWDQSPTPPLSYSVYLSSDITRVEANDPNYRILNAQDVNYVSQMISTRATVFYWRVISNYPSQIVTGDIWLFRTRPYEIIFNTKSGGKKARYSNRDVNSLAMVIYDANWMEVKYGTIEQDGDANIAVFTFPSGFSYNRRYDIVVIPSYCADDIHTDLNPEYEVNQPRPLSLRVTGNFYFDGKMHIDGNDSTISGSTGDRYLIARCGGFPGPKTNCGEPIASGVFNDHSTALIPTSNYWNLVNCPTSVAGYNQTHTRVDIPKNLTGKFVTIPNDRAKTVFGPGQPANPPYKSGAGGSYGGQGGNSGRGYWFGVETTYGLAYGDARIPFPFGGSAGGWGTSSGGCGGGGGVEIIATGDVNLDAHCEITANGGNTICAASAYAAGGGSGGSVKIIASGTFYNKGSITADGGSGGIASGQPSNTGGGGGGGGRIAINYANGISNAGTIEAVGGAKGYYVDYGGVHTGLARNGEDGTVLLTSDSPKTASAPTPKNGDTKAYIGGTLNDPCNGFVLSWYSGYGASTDRVWFGTSTGSLAPIGSKVTATRGRRSITVSVNKNKKYYWQVRTDNNSIPSDMWSFTTVNWVCPLAVDYGVKHAQITFVPNPNGDDANMGISGPEWDHNRDCVLNDADFWYFARDWQNQELGLSTYPPLIEGTYPAMVNMRALRRFAFEWLDCYARTNDGCAGL
ncbi:MAG: LamG-like jellyroll fold domain-containing protein [Sedimentisphaerales bacterium]